MRITLLCMAALVMWLSIPPTTAFGAGTKHATDAQARILAGECAELPSLLEPNARGGDVASLKLLGVMYDRGCGVPVNMHIAADFFARAHERGAVDPLTIGYLTLLGKDRPRNASVAITLIERSAANGNVFAAHIASVFYAVRNAPGDAARSYRWDRIGVAYNDVTAKGEFGYDLVYGFGGHTDVQRGIRLLREGVASNVSAALLNLGNVYMDGRGGIARDPSRGIALFKRGSALGYPNAKVNLVLAYVETKNTRAIRSDGVRLLEEAIACVEPHEYYDVQLGYLLMANNGAPHDYRRAVGLLREGVALGIPDAEIYLADCYFHGVGVPEDFAQGLRLLRKAVATGSARAKAYLAQVQVSIDQSAVPDPAYGNGMNPQPWGRAPSPVQVITPAPGSAMDPNPYTNHSGHGGN